MRLPAGAVEVHLVHGKPTLLDDQPALRPLLGQPGLQLSLVAGARLHREEQVMRRVARLDPSRTGPGAGEDGLDRTPHPQVAGDLGDTADQPLRRRACLTTVPD